MFEGKDETVKITIDGQEVRVPQDYSILRAAETIQVKIPHLCYHPTLCAEGNCRVCAVAVEGARTPVVASCVYPVSEGMIVRTNTPEVREVRKNVVELMLASHPRDCLLCPRNGDCELQQVAAELGIREIAFDGERRKPEKDLGNPAICRDLEKCILCTRCVRVCSERQGLGIYATNYRGFDSVVEPAFGLGLNEVACTYCGQCAAVCPTAALTEKDDTQALWDVLSDPDKHVIVQTAPAVRVALGEAFGMPPGSIVTGRMVAALRRMGFDRVFDTAFTADLTVMEEGYELLYRIQTGGVLPQITSCSPGWVNYVETRHPEIIPNLSTAKSPQAMFGAVAKSYYAEREGLDPARIVCVSVMPCTAKKAEAAREELCTDGRRDVDIVVTTREFARMIKEAGIDFRSLPNEDFDAPMGISSGSGRIFGATGGVREAALRMSYEAYTGRTLERIEFHEIRGLEGIKEAEVDFGGGLVLKVAAVHTLRNAEKLAEEVQSGTSKYHFIEVMACPGGCIGGGGQPYARDEATLKARMEALYEGERQMRYRKSHENPAIVELYETWLGVPLGEKSHELLHTHYTPQKERIW